MKMVVGLAMASLMIIIAAGMHNYCWTTSNDPVCEHFIGDVLP